jgi:hypothetical protein
MDKTYSQTECDATCIPEGYVEIKGPNGQLYLVPEFYAPALHNNLDGYDEKNKLEIGNAAGSVSNSFLHLFLTNPVADMAGNIFTGRHYFSQPGWPTSIQSAGRLFMICASASDSLVIHIYI